MCELRLKGDSEGLLYVSDTVKTADWMRETLESPLVVETSAGSVAVKLSEKGSQLRLLTTEPALGPDYGKGRDLIGGPSGVTFVTPDLDEAYKTLSSRGVSFTEVPKEQPWGTRRAKFTDPDGNWFVLEEEPRR